MKILLATLLVCVLQSKCHGHIDTKQVARAFPEQKIIPFHRNIQILNAQKFIRTLPEDAFTTSTTESVTPESYTVFPPIPTKIKKVTYFPIETLFDQRRNKFRRMLPDHGLVNFSRFKRSANFANITKSKGIHRPIKTSDTSRRDRKGNSNVGRARVKNNASNKQNTRGNVRNRNKTSGKNQPRLRTNKTNVQNKQTGNLKGAASKAVRTKSNRSIKNHETKQAKVTKRNTKSIRLGNDRNKMRKNLHGHKDDSNKRGNAKPKDISHKVNVSRRLIAAKEAQIEEFPYVVSIQKSHQHWCAGAILNQRIVITTANCVWKSVQVSRMKIRAGTRHTDRGGQIARVQELMRHPGFSLRHNPDNDVALLLLDRNLRFSDAVHSVDLPNRRMMPNFNDAWVTSWGSDRRDGVYVNTGLALQAYHARIMDTDKCQNITLRYGVLVTQNFFCMSQMGRRSPCTRDTGAPAVSDGVLWGLASWGLRKLCGTERFPAVFSYIASESLMNFIENSTRLLMSDERIYPFPDRIHNYKIKQLMLNMSRTKQ